MTEMPAEVFASLARKALQDLSAYGPVILRDLASRWLSNEVVLVIDAGDEDELTLSAHTARWLLGRCLV
jgi:hypothetical protein